MCLPIIIKKWKASLFTQHVHIITYWSLLFSTVRTSSCNWSNLAGIFSSNTLANRSKRVDKISGVRLRTRVSSTLAKFVLNRREALASRMTSFVNPKSSVVTVRDARWSTMWRTLKSFLKFSASIAILESKASKKTTWGTACEKQVCREAWLNKCEIYDNKVECLNKKYSRVSQGRLGYILL